MNCLACGTSNPSDYRYCHKCGRPRTRAVWDNLNNAHSVHDWSAVIRLTQELLDIIPKDLSSRSLVDDYAHCVKELGKGEENTSNLDRANRLISELRDAPWLQMEFPIDSDTKLGSESSPSTPELPKREPSLPIADLSQVQEVPPDSLKLLIPVHLGKLRQHESEFANSEVEVSKLLEDIKAFAAEGRTILLTGYGNFEGASIIKGAIAKAREELQKHCKNKGVRDENLIFVVRVQILTHPRYHELEWLLRELVAQVYFEFTRQSKSKRIRKVVTYLKEQSERLGSKETSEQVEERFSPEVTFGIGTNTTIEGGIRPVPGETIKQERSAEAVYHQVFETLRELGRPTKLNRAESLLGSLKYIQKSDIPYRIIIIFDDVTTLDTLLQLEPILAMEGICSIVVTEQTYYDEWKARSEWHHIGRRFKIRYIPCRWKIAHEICGSAVDAEFIPRGYELELYQAFKMYLDFVAKGIPGEAYRVLREMAISRERVSDRGYVQVAHNPQRVNALSEDLIWQNARLQDCLSKHGRIREGIPGYEPETQDRTVRLAYLMAEWLSHQESTFTEREGFESFCKNCLEVGPYRPIAKIVFGNVMKIFVEANLLDRFGDEYVLGHQFFPAGRVLDARLTDRPNQPSTNNTG